MHGLFHIVLGTIETLISLALVGGLVFWAIKRSNEPAKNVFKILLSLGLVIGTVCFIRWQTGRLAEGLSFGNVGLALFITGSIAVCGICLSVIWTPGISDWLFSPLTNALDGGHEPPERKPFYSIALTHRNRGRPQEAILEIRRQLAGFPNDFEGVLLLARVQAEDLADLAGAEMTLGHFCEWPGAPSKQVAAAYTQLADWQLKLGKNAEAAREALRRIIARFPDTETALQAEQRIAHLSDAEKLIQVRQERKNIELPTGAQNIGLLDSTDFLKPQEVAPGKLAAAYVKHLQAHPHDTEVREKLALSYARDFQRLDLATMELAELINEPKHKPKDVARWLNLLANLQVELGADIATVRATLHKIVERFPTLPLADLAQRRIARLGNEFKGLRSSASVKLGTYEQNVGLKYGKPRQE
jgi:tetratricopeptide (TPR) repeat protein